MNEWLSDDEIDDDEYDDHMKKIEFGSLKSNKDSAKIMIYTDKRRLQQIMLNIQSNALKFSDPGSSVQIFYSVYEKDGKSFVEVQCKDKGAGTGDTVEPPAARLPTPTDIILSNFTRPPIYPFPLRVRPVPSASRGTHNG